MIKSDNIKKETLKLFSSKEVLDNITISKIFELNKNFVQYLVSKHIFVTPQQNLYEDIIQIGYIGLYKSIIKFDCTKDFKFNNFAAVCILNEIKCFLRSFNAKNEQMQDYINNNYFQYYYDENFLRNDSYLLKIIFLLFKEKSDFILTKLKFNEFENYSQSFLGEKYHLSQSYVSRVMNKQLDELKEFISYKDGVINIVNYNLMHRLLCDINIINLENDAINLKQYLSDFTLIEIKDAIKSLSFSEINLMLDLNMAIYYPSKEVAKIATKFKLGILPKIEKYLKSYIPKKK